jgi:hypothetical protein
MLSDAARRLGVGSLLAGCLHLTLHAGDTAAPFASNISQVLRSQMGRTEAAVVQAEDHCLVPPVANKRTQVVRIFGFVSLISTHVPTGDAL